MSRESPSELAFGIFASLVLVAILHGLIRTRISNINQQSYS